MLLEAILKKAIKEKPKSVAKKLDEDFIPYVCHYDPHTILTKNGELLQIIRITGFNNDAVISHFISLRDAVRDAIIDHVKDNKFAFWFSTIRRKKNLCPKGKFKDFFSKKINEEWVKENSWDDQYVNELYITIIIEGVDTSLVNINSFLRSFSYSATKSLHAKFLQNAHQELSKVTKNILNEIKEYGAKLLGVREWQGVLYSEPMRFFGKIANLYEERYPLSANDISSDLSSHKVAFGDREIEVFGYNNKNFATMLSLKEYSEIAPIALDRILQLPFEFIITQSFDFAFTSKELEPCEYQNQILQVSGDEDFRQMSGVANFIESKHDLPTDYGKLQTTIMLISSTQEELEKDVKLILEQFNLLGFVIVREDLFSEHCFWAQLPGNFCYLRRQKIINSYRIAGFAALNNFPNGLIAENHWGNAVTVFKTVLNSPYFFNFHKQDSGHSLIFGPQKSGKSTLLNFLLTQSRKFDGKLFYFDFNKKAKCFIKAISGKYYDISENNFGDESLHLNPLALPRTDENKNFLNEFFRSLVTLSQDQIGSDELGFIPQIIDQIFSAGVTNFPSAIEIFNNSETRNIYKKLKIWNGERLNQFFGSNEEIDWSDQIMAFDLTSIFSQKATLVPVVNYLLYQIEKSLDGSPSIIVLNDAWDLLDNVVIAPKISDFLTRMREKNCMVIFTSKDDKNLQNNDLTEKINQQLVTKIFTPNKNPSENYKAVFGFSEEEYEILSAMEKDENHFLLKHDEDSVISSLSFSNFIEALKIFSADEVTLLAMEEVISSYSDSSQPNPTPEIWLPQFFEVLRAIEDDMIEEEKRRIREEFIEKRKKLKKEKK